MKDAMDYLMGGLFTLVLGSFGYTYAHMRDEVRDRKELEALIIKGQAAIAERIDTLYELLLAKKED